MDKEDKVLEGIQSDGTREFKTPVSFGGNIYYVSESPEWLRVITDIEGKIIAGIKRNGSTYISQLEGIDIDSIKQEIQEYIESITSNIKYITDTFEYIEDQEGRSEITTDADGKIISYRDIDGVKHEEAGIETENIKAKKYVFSGDNLIDIINVLKEQGLLKDYDNFIPKVLVTSENLTVEGDNIEGLTLEKNSVDCQIAVITPSQNFIDDNCKIAYQGNSTLFLPKKGFTLDFGKEHRFGTWLAFDSFHCKGYYTDWLHIKDWLANKIIELGYNLRDFSINRPYKKYNDFSKTEIGNVIEGGALCHTDEFPVELYINDNYWGLYSFRVKKSRSNYMLTKKNIKHIQVEAAESTYYTDEYFVDGGEGWKYIEIRNPNKDSGNTSFNAQVEPAYGEIKVAWQNFIHRLNSITDNTSVEELEEFLNIPEWVDAILQYQFQNNSDVWCKNTLYTCWDSKVNLETGEVSGHWSPCLYDFDVAFSLNYAPERNVFDGIVYLRCPWIRHIETVLSARINTRYKELRDGKVFDYSSIVKLVNDRTMETGSDVYKRDANRWNYPTPESEKPIGTNEILEEVRRKIAYMDTVYNYN